MRGRKRFELQLHELFGDLGDHRVLAGELAFQRLDLAFELALPFAPAVLPREGGLTVLEELLLPVVEQARRDLVLLADLGNRNLLQQVQPEDFDFIFGAEMPPRVLSLVSLLVAHFCSPSGGEQLRYL